MKKSKQGNLKHFLGTFKPTTTNIFFLKTAYLISAKIGFPTQSLL